MTFKNDVFVKEMNMIVDPRNSPMPPASLHKKEEENNKTKKSAEPEEDPYATAIASVDLFAGQTDELKHQKTIDIMSKGRSSMNVKFDDEEDGANRSERTHTKEEG